MLKTNKVDILGETWTIEEKHENEDTYLKKVDGYCDFTIKKITIAKLDEGEDTYKDLDVYRKKTIRHELIHAFLDESGLMHNSNWARNEEAIDYFAAQFPKMAEAFNKLGIL